MAFFHFKKKNLTLLHLEVIFKHSWPEANFSHNWIGFFFS